MRLETSDTTETMTATARHAAEVWIRDYLNTYGPQEGNAVINAGITVGFARATLYRAAQFLNIVKRYENGRTTWEMPTAPVRSAPVKDEHGLAWANKQ